MSLFVSLINNMQGEYFFCLCVWVISLYDVVHSKGVNKLSSAQISLRSGKLNLKLSDHTDKLRSI